MPTNDEPTIYWAAHEDEEFWIHEDPRDAVDELLDGITEADALDKGVVLDIYSGEVRTSIASGFLPDIQDALKEKATERCGEASENWLCGNCDGLQAVVEQVVDAWCEKEGQQPTFGTMKNIKAVSITITNDQCGWEFTNPVNS